MDDPRKVILLPVITEKSTQLAEGENAMGEPRIAYTFKVARRASKPEIRQAVEAIFNVKVKSVNTLYRRSKLRRTRRGGLTRTSEWKKAIVTLKQGHKIELR
jgi:large subunit ribosomal protein L23